MAHLSPEPWIITSGSSSIGLEWFELPPFSGVSVLLCPVLRIADGRGLGPDGAFGGAAVWASGRSTPLGHPPTLRSSAGAGCIQDLNTHTARTTHSGGRRIFSTRHTPLFSSRGTLAVTVVPADGMISRGHLWCAHQSQLQDAHTTAHCE